MKKELLLTAILTAATVLTGCGGGSSSSTTTAQTITGKFIDSAVQGLEYSCSSGNSGVTVEW